MADYYFPEVNTNGQFTDPNVIADIQAKAKSSIDAVVPPNGTEGHALVKTSTGTKWGSVESPYELRGTGFPEGKVTANPGTYYTDTDVTNGAWRWFKKTGTGNTGWVVQDGDTGWRLLTDPAAIPVVIYARRLNSAVEVRGYIASHGGTVLRTAGTSYYVEQGLGFRPSKLAAPGHRNMGGIGATFADRTNMDHANPIAVMVVGTETAHDIYWGRITITDRRATGVGEAAVNYTTSEPWPSTLPGTAA